MAITTTDRFALPQWGLGSDSPSRTAFNNALARIDSRAAYDDGAAGGTALPTSEVVNGRYAQTTDGNYRRLFRRVASGWQQVGGNTWAETQYHRAEGALGTGAAARILSHPSLAVASATENWDGSSLRGGRQAIADLNAGQPGALHVGDPASAVDLTTRGRIFARTTADGQRGFVASAHAAGAGHLFAAMESGGTIPWYVDAQGRQRSQAPSAFGGAALTAGVPLASAPGATDVTAADFFAASGKPAVRVLRALGDTSPIASFEQDKITLGRSSWSGATLELRAPAINLFGALDVTGASVLDSVTVGGTLGVSGAATLGAVSAGAVTGSSLTATGALGAHGGLLSTAARDAGAELRTRPPDQLSGTNQQSVRAPMVYRKTARLDRVMSQGRNVQATYDTTVVMPEDGWMQLDTEILVLADLGDGGAIETHKFYATLELRNSGNSSALDTGVERAMTITTDDTVRQISGQGETMVRETFTPRLSAGTYYIRLRYSYASVLAATLQRIIYSVTPVVLLGDVTVTS